MRLLNRVTLLIVTILLGLISGCNSPVFNQTQNNIADVTQRSKDSIKKSDNDAKPSPSLVVNQGLYVDQTPISLAKAPAWLKNHIVLRGDELPFSYYSRTVASGGGKIVLTRYQVGLDPTVKLSMSYSGSVKGALDLLAAKTGYVYAINGNDVYWQAFVTKTFSIAFMPGTSDYLMGKSSGASTGAAASGGGGGGASSTATTTSFLDDSSSSQYSNMRGTLSVWDDLKNTVSQLLSSEGKVIVSQATTSVTIRDKPSNVDLVSKYIKNLNRTLSSQVLVKVEVLDIQLSNDFIFGINWNAVQANFGRKANLIFQGNYGQPITIAPLTAGAPVPTFGFANEGTGRPTFFTSLVNTLQQQGKVSVVSEPRVVCLNNQVSAIRIVRQTGYLASLQNTSFGASTASASAQTAVTTQITPGTVVTGLTLYVLPKILGNKIYLQVNADLSTLNRIQNISSTGSDLSTTTTNTAPIIQVPDVSQKQFNQRSVIRSGETLVLSGFRQVANHTGAQQLLNSQDLGGKASQEQNVETIVLITPIILPGAGVS